MEAALFNWPPLITKGLCRPLPLLFVCWRRASGSICVDMDSGRVFFSAIQLLVQLPKKKLVQNFGTNVFFSVGIVRVT